MARSLCTISIFSDVRKHFWWCKRKPLYLVLIASPVLIFPLLILLIAHITHTKLFEVPCTNYDFNMLVLTADAIYIVLIGAVTYLYKAKILHVDENNVVTIKALTEDMLNKMGVDKNDINRLDFVGTSIEHLKDTLERFEIAIKDSNDFLYFLESSCIFLSVNWALFDFPLRNIGFTQHFWNKVYFFIGFNIIVLIPAYMLFHGIVLVIQYLFNKRIEESWGVGNIRQKWQQFQMETKELDSDKIAENIERFRKTLSKK